LHAVCVPQFHGILHAWYEAQEAVALFGIRKYDERELASFFSFSFPIWEKSLSYIEEETFSQKEIKINQLQSKKRKKEKKFFFFYVGKGRGLD
jgi:hypothetical protein